MIEKVKIAISIAPGKHFLFNTVDGIEIDILGVETDSIPGNISLAVLIEKAGGGSSGQGGAVGYGGQGSKGFPDPEVVQESVGRFRRPIRDNPQA